MDRQKKYEAIKKLVDENGNKDRAAMTLNITRRHVNRLIKAYLKSGKAAFVHGDTGRKPATTVPDDIRASIVELYHAKYYDANFTHFFELLESHENISVSVGTAASILEAGYILSPKVTKAKKKQIAKQLRQKQDAAKTQKEKDAIQKNIAAVEDTHTYTQLAYACKQLGMELESSSVPQAKGRVERLNQTLQPRLPVELRAGRKHDHRCCQ